MIDDEPVLAEAIAELLGMSGHRVTTASSGTEALALAAESDFHLVIADMMMPYVTGDEVLAALRAQGGPARWLVLMSAAPEQVVRARAGACNDFLRKPIRPGELDQLAERCANSPEISARLHANMVPRARGANHTPPNV
ncbi:MAG: response regulator [Pseudomonadota bacterium]|nr:response regulator [Pseudomonadota bacterium]